MLLMRIERWDARRDGPFSERALYQELEACGYQVSARTYPGGMLAAVQACDGEYIQAVVTGLLKVSIDGESATLATGDLVLVPRRRLEVVGPSPAVCLDGAARS